MFVFRRAHFFAYWTGRRASGRADPIKLKFMIHASISLKTHRIAVVLPLVLLITIAGCQKSKPLSKRGKIDPCSLITDQEVGGIQGSPVKETKGSENADGSFRIAQCFYTVDPFNRSISIAVTQADPASAKPRDPRVFWKETFARYEGKAEKEEGDEKKKESLREQEEEKTTPPKKLDGIGDAAYWTANRMGGALYVLKDDVFIRISVGGPDSEDSKINRCKALAEKALSRL